MSSKKPIVTVKERVQCAVKTGRFSNEETLNQSEHTRESLQPFFRLLLSTEYFQIHHYKHYNLKNT